MYFVLDIPAPLTPRSDLLRPPRILAKIKTRELPEEFEGLGIVLSTQQARERFGGTGFDEIYQAAARRMGGQQCRWIPVYGQ